jgi:branched-chain amino acid:cation transporter, LIVCS family
MKTYRLVSVGLAIFAMLFGAGNVVFPLGLGRASGPMVLFAIAGLMLTGVVVPLIGLVAATLFDGDYKKFLGMTGKIPGAIIAFVCLMLIGPFGATPRCITLAHAAVRWHIPQLSLIVFSIIASCLVFAATIKKNHIVGLMGRVFGPIKLVLLTCIIVLGLTSSNFQFETDYHAFSAFIRGFQEGYMTLDLIGVIFFSGLIITAIRSQLGNEKATSRQVAIYGLKAGLIGGSALGAVYAGFCLVAAKYGADIAFVDQDQLLSALATLILGARASILANTTMAIACMTTAIALTAVFADYLTNELFRGRINYYQALLSTVLITFVMTNLGFSGIAKVIEPVVMFCYPSLIVLSLANIAHVLWGFKYVQLLVGITFLLSIVMHFLH